MKKDNLPRVYQYKKANNPLALRLAYFWFVALPIAAIVTVLVHFIYSFKK
jgi:hypothetical protein